MSKICGCFIGDYVEHLFIVENYFTCKKVNAIIEPAISSEGMLKWVSFGMNMAYYGTIVLSLIVLGNEFRNKTLKNAISGGISENKTYFGKVIDILEDIICLIYNISGVQRKLDKGC